MATARKTPVRAELRPEDTWDLSPLFESDEAWEAAFRELEGRVAGFEQFRGRLGESAQVLRDCYEFEIEVDKLAERVQSYAFLKSSENVADSACQGMVSRCIHLGTMALEAASYIAPEIQAIPEDRMQAFLADPVLADYRFAIEKLLRFKPHILSAAEERILAMQGEVAGSARRIFEQLNDADLRFGEIVNERGETIELTHASFRSLLESPSREVRRTAFHQLYDEYEAHANTLAASLSASVLQDVYVARVRNFPSAREAALFGDNIPVGVYDSLIEAVHANLDTLYRYFALRRRALNLDEIHAYDTYVPIVDAGPVHNPYEKAAHTVYTAVEPLGPEYQEILHKGLTEERWVDRYESKGKRSGAFSAGGFTGPPYILMNYRTDVIDSMFTLAHEAGHSMHTHYSARNQPFQYYDYTIFTAEVASTFNEQLLNRYLLEHATDARLRAYLISRELDEIRGTIIRQTMFAEFERATHAIAEAGEPLTLERIRGEYRALLDRYFGPDFAIDDQLSLEALRIPHFYSAFYVYKYATGLAAAIALSRRVLEGGDAERDAYLNFLSSGGSKFPLELLRDAGVDMTGPEPVETALAHFKELVDELESLLEGEAGSPE